MKEFFDKIITDIVLILTIMAAAVSAGWPVLIFSYTENYWYLLILIVTIPVTRRIIDKLL